jgi:hypothetical protein
MNAKAATAPKKGTTVEKQAKAAVVTPEPQHKEHMHLKYIEHSPALVDVYLKVSDDDGSAHENKPLEEAVIKFTEQYMDKDPAEIENPEAVLSELRQLYGDYSKQINRCDSIFGGYVTKYRIRQGMLLLIEKKLLKMESKKWMDHFSETYGLKHLRSAHDYMALAKVPNIIRYSVFKKARLIEILRAVKVLDIGGDDPVAGFLDRFKVVYNPEDSDNDELLDELRNEIDAAIAAAKIQAVEKKHGIKLGVKTDLIKALIVQGIEVENGLISDMIIIKKNAGNVNKHLKDLCESKGSQPACLENTKRVEGLDRLVAGISSTVKYLKDHPDVLEMITQDQVTALEDQVQELKALVASA